MTDYGQFYDKDGNLEKYDSSTTPKNDRCSGDTSLKLIIRYAKQLNKLRKEAASAGVCLDELEEVAKELSY
jgi:hypothetical protein